MNEHKSKIKMERIGENTVVPRQRRFRRNAEGQLFGDEGEPFAYTVRAHDSDCMKLKVRGWEGEEKKQRGGDRSSIWEKSYFKLLKISILNPRIENVSNLAFGPCGSL